MEGEEDIDFWLRKEMAIERQVEVFLADLSRTRLTAKRVIFEKPLGNIIQREFTGVGRRTFLDEVRSMGGLLYCLEDPLIPDRVMVMAVGCVGKLPSLWEAYEMSLNQTGSEAVFTQVGFLCMVTDLLKWILTCSEPAGKLGECQRETMQRIHSGKSATLFVSAC